MIKQQHTVEKRQRRHARIRARVSGTAATPRVVVTRSLRGVSLQAIDDQTGKTVAQAHYRELGKKAKNTLKEAAAVGRLLGERLAKHGLNQAVFDRAGYLYHGKIKAAANGIRESGVTM